MKLVLKYIDSQKLKSILGKELVSLKSLTPYLDDMEQKMAVLYANKFPKKCNTCDKIFSNREEYIAGTRKVTTPTSPGGSVLNNQGVLEFRNCKCGSTLLILLANRRDESEFGIKRREIFAECVEKVVSEGVATRERAHIIVRELFRYFIKFYSGKITKKLSETIDKNVA